MKQSKGNLGRDQKPRPDGQMRRANGLGQRFQPKVSDMGIAKPGTGCFRADVTRLSDRDPASKLQGSQGILVYSDGPTTYHRGPVRLAFQAS